MPPARPGAARRRARRSLLVGDAALVAALAGAAAATGTWTVPGTPGAADALAGEALVGVPALDAVAVLLVGAGVARSALVPLHRWLAPTVAAPTPVSVLLHAGFISGAGVLVLRTAPVVTGSAVATHLLLALAVATVVVGTLARPASGSTARASWRGRRWPRWASWPPSARSAPSAARCSTSWATASTRPPGSSAPATPRPPSWPTVDARR